MEKVIKWLEVDLGQSYDIDSWMVKHAGAFGEDNGYNTKAFKLQYKEVDTWRDAAVVTNNTDSVTEAQSILQARLYDSYNRTDNNGDPAARIFQFKVFGEAVSDESYHVYYDGNGALEGSAPVDDNEYRINDAVQVKPTLVVWLTRATDSLDGTPFQTAVATTMKAEAILESVVIMM